MDKETISYDDFCKLDLVIAIIESAEAVPKTDRLVKLSLNIGEEEPRTVVAGIREHYQPDVLVGKQVVYLANLAPRKLRGIESTGMILAAFWDVETEDGGKNKLSLLGPFHTAANGAQVG
jgi:methionyl-tRNA synthetase